MCGCFSVSEKDRSKDVYLGQIPRRGAPRAAPYCTARHKQLVACLPILTQLVIPSLYHLISVLCAWTASFVQDLRHSIPPSHRVDLPGVPPPSGVVILSNSPPLPPEYNSSISRWGVCVCWVDSEYYYIVMWFMISIMWRNAILIVFRSRVKPAAYFLCLFSYSRFWYAQWASFIRW